MPHTKTQAIPHEPCPRLVLETQDVPSMGAPRSRRLEPAPRCLEASFRFWPCLVSDMPTHRFLIAGPRPYRAPSPCPPWPASSTAFGTQLVAPLGTRVVLSTAEEWRYFLEGLHRGSWPWAQALVSHVELPVAGQAWHWDGCARNLRWQVPGSCVECAEWVHRTPVGVRFSLFIV